MSIKRHGRVAVLAMVLAHVGVTNAFAQSAAANPVSRFAGTWREDVSKRSNAHAGMPPLRFQENAQGGLEEVRTPETQPEIQPVVFDGKPRQTRSGSTFVWKRVDANTFERSLSRADGTATTRRLRLSEGGRALSETVDRTEGGTLTVTYRRSSGAGQGLVGVWEPVSVEADPVVITYEPVDSNSLKVTERTHNGLTYTVTLGGEPVPVVAPGVYEGSTTAARVLDDRTIEMIGYYDGVEDSKTVLTVSADGRTITSKTMYLGKSPSKEPIVQVLVKQ